jgi:hypothetical protein
MANSKWLLDDNTIWAREVKRCGNLLAIFGGEKVGGRVSGGFEVGFSPRKGRVEASL